MFTNRITEETTTECTEERGGRWFIKMGFAGFNTPKNNRDGYDTKAKAEATCLKYQSR